MIFLQNVVKDSLAKEAVMLRRALDEAVAKRENSDNAYECLRDEVVGLKNQNDLLEVSCSLRFAFHDVLNMMMAL